MDALANVSEEWKTPTSIEVFRVADSTPLVDEPVNVKSTNEHRVLALDGIRGLAILGVFCYHFGGGHQSRNFIVHAWSLAAGAGWMGVDLFFVLSGFLITGILFDTSHKQGRVKNFYVRRALRIFPLFYGVLFAFLALTPILHLRWHFGHLLYFFYMSNMAGLLDPGLQSPGDKMVIIHFWSLAVEEQFYLLWPFVVWFVKDRRKLLWICLGIILSVLALRSILVLHGVSNAYIFPLLPTRADSLLCGGALALLVRGPARLESLARVIIVVTGVLTLGIVRALAAGPRGEALLSGVGYTVIALFFTCVVYFAQRGGGWVAYLGRQGWLRFLGRYSYGLYIYQGLLLFSLMPLVDNFQRLVHSALLGGLLFIAFSLALIIGISMLSYHLFEGPILKLKSRFV